MASNARKGLKGSDDMAGAVEEWMGEIEKSTGLRVRIVITRDTLRRRLVVRAEACQAVDNRLVAVEVQLRSTFPNGNAVTLGGELLRLLVGLDKELATQVFDSESPSVEDSPG